MKKITKERILHALDSIARRSNARVDKLNKIVSLYCLHGYQNIVKRNFTAVLAAIDIDPSLVLLTESQSRNLVDECFRRSDHYCKYSDKVFDIQAHHCVSGLEPIELWLGDFKLDVMSESKQLRLICEDLEILSRQKQQVLTFYLDYIGKCKGILYIWNNDDATWDECSIDKMKIVLNLDDWIVCKESVTFTSPSILKSRGHDDVRSIPQFDDDQMRREVHLYSFEGSEDTGGHWFCFANKIPYY